MSEPKKSGGIPKPGCLYRPAASLLGAFLRLTARLRVTGLDQFPTEGPVLLLMSHHGMADFAAAAALCPRPIHFVCTEHYFRDKRTGPLLRYAAAIPKIQFHPDPRCIMSIFKTLRAGRVVGIFPAGQTSVMGRPPHVPAAIGRLARKSGAAIVTMTLRGSYFYWSRFSGLHPGPMEARFQLLHTPEQCAAMTDDALYREICAALDFDEFAQAEAAGAKYRGDLADGYDSVLWLCPKCGALHSIRSTGKRVCCRACGAAGTLEPDMTIRSDSFPRTLGDWYNGPQRAWLAENTAPISLPVELQRYDGTRFLPAGPGTVTLTPEALTCTGRPAGPPWQFHAESARQEGLFCSLGRFFELYDPELGPIRCHPAERSAVSLVQQAQAYYFEKSHE